MSKAESIRVSRQAIPEEVAKEAASELTELLLDIDNHDEIVAFESYPVDPNLADRVSLSVTTSDEIARFYKVAPTTASILDSIGGKEDESGYMSFFPGSVTINYALPGQHIGEHTDDGDEGIPRVARVINLSGVGKFALKDPRSLVETAVDDLVPGDIHEFDNPASISDRSPHYAVNTGDTERITLGYQLPIETA